MYLAKIEECFSKHSRRGIILSPHNWLIAERWEHMGIPIEIVCRGIKKACRQYRSSHTPGEEWINLLTYCEPEIHRLWKEYKQALLGAPEGKKKKGRGGEATEGLRQTIQGRLDAIRKDLGAAEQGGDPFAEIKVSTLRQLDWSNRLDSIKEQCCKEGDIVIESIERGLTELEGEYLHTLISLLPRGVYEEWMQSAEEELLPYKGQMDTDTYKETLALAIESLLRERLNLRRISLYAT